jgi:protocatechuate 3,4-dioxygenase beta subunit
MPRNITQTRVSIGFSADAPQWENDMTRAANPRPNNRATLERRAALTAIASAAVMPGTHAQTVPAPAQRRSTPEQTLGPFYPRSPAEMPRETDPDLLGMDGDRVLAKGTPMYLTGRVLSRNGQAIANALVEIWQCDAHAVYHHPAGGAEPSRDPHFQGYGTARTDADGVFHFRTIKPVPYPGRTPHIHMRVATAIGTIATQWYLPGDPGNAGDVLYRRMGETERNALHLTLREGAPAAHPLARSTRLAAQVDVVIG